MLSNTETTLCLPLPSPSQLKTDVRPIKRSLNVDTSEKPFAPRYINPQTHPRPLQSTNHKQYRVKRTQLLTLQSTTFFHNTGLRALPCQAKTASTTTSPDSFFSALPPFLLSFHIIFQLDIFPPGYQIN